MEQFFIPRPRALNQTIVTPPIAPCSLYQSANGQILKWSHPTKPIPDIGAEVCVRMNSFGKSCVVGYFSTSDTEPDIFLGIMVVPYTYPKWYRRATASGSRPFNKAHIICVFGLEME